MVIGYANNGLTGASQRMHRYICERLLPAKFRDRPRPILYNSWYATGFDVNEKHQLALAAVAKEIGVEMFVIDDGWFKGRVNDRGGLGDWTVDKNKFPSGLKPMIDKINAMGLDFGIWVEPEMVNPNSDLYRAHPDWVFHYPKRVRHEQRNQLMLNLAREDVYNYLLDSMTNLLKENNIKFIKWDRNRALTEPGWPDAPADMQREARIRYTHNLYRLIETLRERFPDVWFESCSGGGGRSDLGMLGRMDQTWVSDDTDPVNRILIQYGYLHAFPARTMVSWITHEDWGGIRPSLEYRFHVAMAGVLGIGFDITKWTPRNAKPRRLSSRSIRRSARGPDGRRLPLDLALREPPLRHAVCVEGPLRVGRVSL
jgi:alpha-galactosidase